MMLVPVRVAALGKVLESALTVILSRMILKITLGPLTGTLTLYVTSQWGGKNQKAKIKASLLRQSPAARHIGQQAKTK